MASWFICILINIPYIFQFESKHVEITLEEYNAAMKNETFDCWVATSNISYEEADAHDLWTVHISLNGLFLRVLPTVFILTMNMIMIVKIHRIFKERQRKFLKRESLPAIATIENASYYNLFPKTFDFNKCHKSLDKSEVMQKIIKKW